MTLKIVEKKIYDNIIGDGLVFHSSSFNEINKRKVDNVFYVVIYNENSPRFAFPIGIKKTEAFCPFSAPFSYPQSVKKGVGVEEYELAEKLLSEFMKENNIQKLRIVFPPDFYDHRSIVLWENVLQRGGWKICCIDLNFAMDLRAIKDRGYETLINRNAKRNLIQADKMELKMHCCVNEDERKLAYDIIRQNRMGKGYPLRMTLEQVLQTMEIVCADMYMVEAEGKYIAAALIYEVNEQIAQVVYWGDIPGNEQYKSINYLARELVQIYTDKGFAILDIGPSTEHGKPNYGLCDFKERIGCFVSTKKTWMLEV